MTDLGLQAFHVAQEHPRLTRCGPVERGGNNNGNTGRCLDNNDVKDHAVEFANDQDAWLEQFAESFQKMVEVGYGQATNNTLSCVTGVPCTSSGAGLAPTASVAPSSPPAPTAPPECLEQTLTLSSAEYTSIYTALGSMFAADQDAIRNQNRNNNNNNNNNNRNNDALGDLVGVVLRLSFHDAVEFDRNQADALGVDGCVDLNHPDNNGLAPVIATLNEAHAPFCNIISRADFWVLAAKVAVESTSVEPGYTLPFRFGRRDAATCSYPGGRLPGAELGIEEIERVFVGQMGLTVRDAAALLGAHTLGRVEAANSGYHGPNDDEFGQWTNNPVIHPVLPPCLTMALRLVPQLVCYKRNTPPSLLYHPLCAVQ